MKIELIKRTTDGSNFRVYKIDDKFKIFCGDDHFSEDSADIHLLRYIFTDGNYVIDGVCVKTDEHDTDESLIEYFYDQTYDVLCRQKKTISEYIESETKCLFLDLFIDMMTEKQ